MRKYQLFGVFIGCFPGLIGLGFFPVQVLWAEDFSEKINMAIGNIGNMVKDVKESGNALEMKINADESDEIKKAFELHKEQLERIKTKP